MAITTSNSSNVNADDPPPGGASRRPLLWNPHPAGHLRSRLRRQMFHLFTYLGHKRIIGIVICCAEAGDPGRPRGVSARWLTKRIKGDQR